MKKHSYDAHQCDCFPDSTTRIAAYREQGDSHADGWSRHHPAHQPEPDDFQKIRPVAVIQIDARNIHPEYSVTICMNAIFIIIGRKIFLNKETNIDTEHQ